MPPHPPATCAATTTNGISDCGRRIAAVRSSISALRCPLSAIGYRPTEYRTADFGLRIVHARADGGLFSFRNRRDSLRTRGQSLTTIERRQFGAESSRHCHMQRVHRPHRRRHPVGDCLGFAECCDWQWRNAQSAVVNGSGECSQSGRDLDAGHGAAFAFSNQRYPGLGNGEFADNHLRRQAQDVQRTSAE